MTVKVLMSLSTASRSNYGAAALSLLPHWPPADLCMDQTREACRFPTKELTYEPGRSRPPTCDRERASKPSGAGFNRASSRRFYVQPTPLTRTVPMNGWRVDLLCQRRLSA